MDGHGYKDGAERMRRYPPHLPAANEVMVDIGQGSISHAARLK